MKKKLIVGGIAALALAFGGVAMGSTGTHVGDDNDTGLPGKGQHGHGLINIGDVNVSADCAAQLTGSDGGVWGPLDLLSGGNVNRAECEPRKAEKNK